MKQVGQATHGEPLHVEARHGLPHRLLWRGRLFQVTSVEAVWCVEGRWWLDALCCGARRRYFRVMARAGQRRPLCLEIYRQGALWRLWRVAD